MAFGSLKRDAGLAGALLSDGCSPAVSPDDVPHASANMADSVAAPRTISSMVRNCPRR